MNTLFSCAKLIVAFLLLALTVSCAAKQSSSDEKTHATSVTVLTTVSATAPTTVPMTVPTTVPTTVLTTAPTTIPKTAPMTTPTTVTTTAATTLPKTAPVSEKGKYEIDADSVRSIRGATVLQAWKINEDGVEIEIHKIAYGSKITQHFVKSKDKSIDYSKTVTYQPVCNVAIITCSPNRFLVETSKKLTGKNVSGVETMGKAAGALIAVNGEAGSSYKTNHASTVRNGNVVASCSDSDSRRVRLLIFNDGRKWYTAPVNTSNTSALIKDGLLNTLSYQDTMVLNGREANKSDSYYENRTVVAQISSDKYILAVGEFMPKDRYAQILSGYGAQEAYLLNGGNCAHMYVKGIGNVTGTRATKLKDLNKVNVHETEFFAANGMLGLNESGKQKLGGPCAEIDIVYVK